jgi:hypothetical protein
MTALSTSCPKYTSEACSSLQEDPGTSVTSTGEIAINCISTPVTEREAEVAVASQSWGHVIVVPHLEPSPVNLAKAEAHVRKMLKRIRAAHLAGDPKRATRLTVEYLRSFNARYVAVARASARMRKNRRPKSELWPGIARRLDAWQGTAEEVIARFKEKKNNPNELRTILDFGIENRALQYLVRSVLEIRADLHPGQYLLQGGVHKAVQKAADELAGGPKWAIESDIRNCYSSFEGKKVPDLLPLPKKVTLQSLLGVSLNMRVLPSQSFGSAELDEYVFGQELADVRRGFPQGSAASPLAVEILLASLYTQLPVAGVSVGYADNFLVMASQEEDAVSTTTAFWSALEAHPAGQLKPKEPKIFEPKIPIEFLGHTLQLQNGAIQIHPTPQNSGDFEARLNAGLRRIRKAIHDQPRAARRAQRLRRYVMSWTGSFKLCDGMDSCRSRALQLIKMAVKGYHSVMVTYSSLADGAS